MNRTLDSITPDEILDVLRVARIDAANLQKLTECSPQRAAGSLHPVYYARLDATHYGIRLFKWRETGWTPIVIALGRVELATDARELVAVANWFTEHGFKV